MLALQIAQIFFEANGKNAKDTIDLLNQTIKILRTSGQSVFFLVCLVICRLLTSSSNSSRCKTRSPCWTPNPPNRGIPKIGLIF